MHTQTKQEVPVADLQAVREFLVSGREIPPAPKTARPPHKGASEVAFHMGIVRARTRSAVKA